MSSDSSNSSVGSSLKNEVIQNVLKELSEKHSKGNKRSNSGIGWYNPIKVKVTYDVNTAIMVSTAYFS
jgi:hypothetical protein